MTRPDDITILERQLRPEILKLMPATCRRTHRMKRRSFIALLGGAAAIPLARADEVIDWPTLFVAVHESASGTDLPTSALQQFRQLSGDQQTASESGRLEAPQDFCVRQLPLWNIWGKLSGCGRLTDVHLRWFRFRAGGGSGHGGDLKAKLSEGYGAV
jgi:hypothetical protein